MSQSVESGTEVLEFALGEETYSVDIRYVEEIVDMGTLTEIPNSAPHVEGVMDLRGRTTTIIDPRTVLGLPTEGDRKRIVIFDPDQMNEQGAIGWIVDDADRVVRVSDEDIESSVGSEVAVEGVIKQEDRFVIQVDPTEVEV